MPLITGRHLGYLSKKEQVNYFLPIPLPFRENGVSREVDSIMLRHTLAGAVIASGRTPSIAPSGSLKVRTTRAPVHGPGAVRLRDRAGKSARSETESSRRISRYRKQPTR
jgi:hypothetical protein